MINGNELRFNKISIQHFLYKKPPTTKLMHYVIHHQNNTILLTSKYIDWLRNNNHKKLFYINKIKFLWLVYSGSVTIRFIYHREMLNRRLRDVLVICVQAGLFVDNIQNEDLTATGHNLYNPHQNPLDLTSPYVPAVFERVTGKSVS